MFCDKQDYQGIEFWYLDVIEQNNEIKNTKKTT